MMNLSTYIYICIWLVGYDILLKKTYGSKRPNSLINNKCCRCSNHIQPTNYEYDKYPLLLHIYICISIYDQSYKLLHNRHTCTHLHNVTVSLKEKKKKEMLVSQCKHPSI